MQIIIIISISSPKNFPPDMLQEVTQERKKHKVIVGTSQVFTRLAKPLREQTTYLCEPHTFFGCFTVCLIFTPELKDDGTLLKKKFYRMFCFVHDDEFIRHSLVALTISPQQGHIYFLLDCFGVATLSATRGFFLYIVISPKLQLSFSHSAVSSFKLVTLQPILSASRTFSPCASAISLNFLL